MPPTNTEERLDREAAFHDATFASAARRAAGKYYATAAGAKADYHDRVLRAGGEGRRVLEYGCGRGSAAFELAARGTEVAGIDISEVGIREATEQGRRLGLEARLTFRQMNAEALEFDAGRFDLVCGSGILHHLDLDRALPEVVRVLRPGGRAVFFEPLGHNPLINLYRRLTPAMRSVDEHPLSMADVARITADFAAAQTRFFGLSTLVAAPLRPAPGARLLRALEAIDRVLLRAPLLQRYAWIVVLDLSRA